MSQTLRIEPDHESVLEFLELTQYPYSIWTEQPELMFQCLPLRVSDEYGIVGYVWGHWVRETSMTCHIALVEGTVLDWDTLLGQLEYLAHVHGADDVVLSFDDHPKALAMGRMVRRFGFHPETNSPLNATHVYRKLLNGRNYPRSTKTTRSRD